jgi:hypothetical protein
MTITKRLLDFSETDLVKDVIASRDKIMLSGQSLNPNFIINHLDTKANFERNLMFGLFEDNVLDCFFYIELWREIPAYSMTMFSRARQGRVKLSNGFDANLTELHDYQLQYTENLGLYRAYGVTNATPKWKPLMENEHSRWSQYEVETVEYIPSGNYSRFPLFRTYLVARQFDVPLNIKMHTLPKNLRSV